ncbi:GGDEF domain-containing protein [Chroococcidiopsis sp. CCALA 051]|uniref:GGDEF domain-containing protein n=1 Tax=Chroococcidiopsis sp. CCALA 051 TaxID=869949 RepID=UPI000D0E0AB6|nr:GGDEF domain-containing protein [Chroococcidiopsis sp. CCALA 051]PSM50411.1 GGDEF domain-containing protein [Chroococcidiopsis sp. CCALA 051]
MTGHLIPKTLYPNLRSLRNSIIGALALDRHYVSAVIAVLPIVEYMAFQNHRRIWLVLVIGLLCTGIFAFCLLTLERTAHVERLVQERTAELSNLNAELNLLNEMNDLLQACLTVEEAHTVIAQVVPRLFPHASGGVFAIAGDRTLVASIAAWETAFSSQKVFALDECFALRRGQMYLAENTRCGLCQHLLSSLPVEYICVPMMAQGEVLGLLYLSYLEKGKLTSAKQRLAVKVAANLALALANLKLREILQNQSVRDPLTDLFNRRYLEATLEREVRRGEREQTPVGIIMLDVDRFKQVNDTFGHPTGDTLLRELGKFLKEQIRAGDIACRYGGEEFMLILPDAPLGAVQQRAERIREAVKWLQLKHQHQLLDPITLSLGVAAFPYHGSTTQELIQAADAALYRAKTEGRDRVVTATI